MDIADNKTVSGTVNVGAIAGTLRGSAVNCPVKGSMGKGRYIGCIAGTYTGSIAQCYAEGTITNATALRTDNYAIKTMFVSVNNVPQTIYDDPINGYAKTEE